MPADVALWSVDLSLRRMARQVAMLETVVLELAREHRIEGLA